MPALACPNAAPFLPPISAFLAAVDFLTVWRLPGGRQIEARQRGLSLYFFGLVGLLIGLLLAAIDVAVQRWWSPPVTSVLLLVALLLVTGGLHFDGLLDTCDAVFSRRTPQERLDILRDSRAGSFAVAAGAINVLLWALCVTDLAGGRHGQALVLMAVTSRAAMVLGVTHFPYGRAEGLGADFVAFGSRSAALLNAALAIGLGFALLDWQGALAAAAGLASAPLAGVYLMRRLPGLTGDCYGAMNEVAQVVTLLALVPLSRGLG